MNNVLQLNYYEEHQKYEGGNGIKFLIDKTNIIGSSSNFAIFGRSSNFCNTKAWQNIFTNIFHMNYKTLNPNNFSDSSKTVIYNINNNSEISSNNSFRTNLSSLFRDLSDEIEKETGLKIDFKYSSDLESCLKENKENVKKNKLVMKKHLSEIKKNIKIGSSSTLKGSNVFDTFVELTKKQKELEKEGITTKLNYSFYDTKIDYDKENIVFLKTYNKLKVTLNSNDFDFQKEMENIESSKLISNLKKKKLIKILNEYHQAYKKFVSISHINLFNISKVLGNEKVRNNVYGIIELEKEVSKFLKKISTLEINNNKTNNVPSLN